MFIKSLVFLLFINEFHRYVCFVWDKMPCSSDEEQTMAEGIEKNTGRFPWLGVLQHSFNVGGKRNYAITGAVLVHPAFAIAAAEDVARIDPTMLENNTELIFWTSEKQKAALTVKDYMLHPEFTEGITTATLALVSIVARYEGDFSDYMAPVVPVCMPMAGIGGYVNMHVAKLTDVTGELQKETFKMNTVDKKECDQFYLESQLHYEKMNPTNPLCASSTNSTAPCIWDSGTALISRQSWGYWQLIGFAVRGPGCSAPTKFLSIVDYLPWMNDVIQSVFKPDADDDSEGDLLLGLRRLSPTKLVFFPGPQISTLATPNYALVSPPTTCNFKLTSNENFVCEWKKHSFRWNLMLIFILILGPTVLPKYLGDCAPADRGRVLWRDTSLFLGNKDFVQGYYLASVTQHASFYCGEVNIRVQRRTNAVMWVENHCYRATEERAIGQDRTGDLERLECFKYFRSTAYMEFKFIFSFHAEFTIAMYGKLDYKEDAYPFMWYQKTTGWWPTWGKVSMRNFQRENIPNAWEI